MSRRNASTSPIDSHQAASGTSTTIRPSSKSIACSTRTCRVRWKPMRRWARSKRLLKSMFQSIATVENISVSAPMCARGLFITSDSTGAVRRTARPSKARAWKIRSLRVLSRAVWVWVMANAPGSSLKSGCIVIGLWDRVKLGTIGKPICICRPNPSRPSSRPFPRLLPAPPRASWARASRPSARPLPGWRSTSAWNSSDRSGRQPQLTEAGRTLLGRVEEVLGASDRLRRVAALLAGGSSHG